MIRSILLLPSALTITSHSLTVANVLLVLKKKNDCGTLGIFLDVEDCILGRNLYESKGIRRCKEELFRALNNSPRGRSLLRL